MISQIQNFEADFLWKVILKILDSGIILKTFTHAMNQQQNPHHRPDSSQGQGGSELGDVGVGLNEFYWPNFCPRFCSSVLLKHKNVQLAVKNWPPNTGVDKYGGGSRISKGGSDV